MHMVQVRVLLYLGALASGILDALTDAERAALSALASPRERRLLRWVRRLIRPKRRAKREAASRRRALLYRQGMEHRLTDMLSRGSVRSTADGKHTMTLLVNPQTMS